jgi:hypothetical protein
MLYEDAKDCLSDGSAEDMIEEALKEAREESQRLYNKLTERFKETA